MDTVSQYAHLHSHLIAHTWTHLLVIYTLYTRNSHLPQSNAKIYSPANTQPLFIAHIILVCPSLVQVLNHLVCVV